MHKVAIIKMVKAAHTKEDITKIQALEIIIEKENKR